MSDNVLTVTQLNRLSKRLLEDHFSDITVLGELSNLSRPRSGHWYFTLKDAQAQLRCAMFRGRNQRINFEPTDGQKLQARGKITLYEGRGDYQLIVDSLQPAGEGLLALQFEQMKQALMAEGYFDPGRKQALPPRIEHLAVITSPTGAALRDILSVIDRRWPLMRVSVLPVPVQGVEAAPAIVKAIADANRWHQQQWRPFDAILLTRGGGSLEDLWAFNERAVADAIHHSALPIVSAVGHETDTVISDFVADLRAPTPSAAAELLSDDATRWQQQLDELQQRLQELLKHRLMAQSREVLHLRRRLRHPGQQLAAQGEQLKRLSLRASHSIQQQIRRERRAFEQVMTRFQRQHPQRHYAAQRASLLQPIKALELSLRRQLQQNRSELSNLQSRLVTVSPKSTLQRGYAIIVDEAGDVLRHTRQVKAGDSIRATLSDGALQATVESCAPDTKSGAQ